MPVLGQTPTEAHLNPTTPAAPSGAVNIAFQASAPYPDPNNPVLQVRDISANLAEFTGDSGSGGTLGAVPAPSAGDATAGKFLKADGTWQIPAGGGGGVPSTANANYVFAGPTSGSAAAPAFRALVVPDYPFHAESLTDGAGNIIFAAGDVVTVVGVSN